MTGARQAAASRENGRKGGRPATGSIVWRGKDGWCARVVFANGTRQTVRLDPSIAREDEDAARLAARFAAIEAKKLKYIAPAEWVEQKRSGGRRRALRTWGRDAVYFLYDERLSRLKIGFSRNVDARQRQLRTALGYRLVLLGSIPGGRANEQAIHHRFEDHRLEGEWFSADVLPAVIELLGGNLIQRVQA